MPVEIRELHVRVTVEEPKPAATGTNAAAGGGNGAAADREAIIAECVEQVMAVLQNKLER